MHESLADQAAIAEAVAKYAYTWDEKDLDAYAALFVEDCTWDLYARGGAYAVHGGANRLCG